MTYVANTHASIDERQAFLFKIKRYDKAGKPHYTGVSMTIYDMDRKDAIKRFCQMFTQTTRFDVFDVSKQLEATGKLPSVCSFKDCVSMFDGVVL